MQQVFTVWDDGKDLGQYHSVNKALEAGAKVAHMATAGTPELHLDAPPGGSPMSAFTTPYAVTVFVLEGTQDQLR